MQKTWIDGPIVTTNLFDHLVQSRHIKDLDHFLSPTWPDDLYDPFLLPDMEKAVKRIWRAIEAEEKIGIVGDYDMDGTPAAALLSQFFNLFNHNPTIILPTREEGYGFSPEFVTRLSDQGIRLIITVDCGTRDCQAVNKAKEIGSDVIVTDHHEVPDDAASCADPYALVNPKRPHSHYPFGELSGAGVAYKLMAALIQQAPPRYRPVIPEAWPAWSLDLVALATIGDMAPLVDENRLLVFYGLKVLCKTSRPGLRRFMETIDLDINNLDCRDVAFKIIPKLNASGRLENMDDVFTLLTSHNVSRIDQAIKQILMRSTQSQLLHAAMLKQAKEKLPTELPAAILLSDERWHPGLTGLVAARLAQEFQRPVGVLASGDGQLFRGSMRSVPGVSLPSLLAQSGSLLERFGGHDQAAGLSIAKEKIPDFTAFLEQSLPNISASTAASLNTDGAITAQHASLKAIEQLETLSPWGIGHPEPCWSLQGVTLENVRWIGNGRHLKAVIMQDGYTVSLICFGAEEYKHVVTQPVDLYGMLAINEFRGKREAQLTVRGICPSLDKKL